MMPLGGPKPMRRRASPIYSQPLRGNEVIRSSIIMMAIYPFVLRPLRCVCVLIGCGSLLAAASDGAVDFDTDIVPLLSKAGCNAASCHGSTAGQGGFRLSLFGGDPEFDYRSIAHEFAGRRLNHVNPPQSLLLAKPTGRLEHGGGEVLSADAARVIAEWIEAGAKRSQLRKLDRLVVTPTTFAAKGVPTSFPLEVVAHFSDGTTRDVTDTALYVSQNDAALDVDLSGLVTVKLAGQHTATVRFADRVTTVGATSPFSPAGVSHPKSARQNWIDDPINAKLVALGLTPAGACRDAEFVRRVSLDLTGRLPSPERVARFVTNVDQSKRTKLVDELLASDEFTSYWTHLLATQLRVQKPATDARAAEAMDDWLRAEVAGDARWDEIARSLILSEGDTHANGAATVHRFFATARDEAEYMSEVLMGVRLRCANCHNHPLDRWTQDDYHGLAAVFVGLERGQVVRDTGRGEITHPRTGAAALARIPGERFLTESNDPRDEFADWLVAPENPYFAHAMSGRVWESLMGRGLVSPVDDVRATNPPSHPELLDRLADSFAAGDYKLRPLIREICNSAAYHRSSTPLEGAPNDDRFYSHALAKPLSAEVLADAIGDVTGVTGDYAGVSRAIDVVDRTVLARQLAALGPCLPGEACSVDAVSQRGIASQLHLMNGGLINAKIGDSNGRLHLLIDLDQSTADIVTEFYLLALSRPPTDAELTGWIEAIDSQDDLQGARRTRVARREDFLWALLNCHEFTTNN